MEGMRLNIEGLEQRIAPDLIDDVYLDDRWNSSVQNGGANPVPAGAEPQPSG